MTPRTISIFLVLTVTLGSTLVLGASVVQAAPTGTPDDPIPLDSCGLIDNEPLGPGTYVLTRDIDATDLGPREVCLLLEQGATVLGNGYRIFGNGDGVGIEADSPGLTIRNLTITGLGTGILFDNSEIEVYDSTISNNSAVGIAVGPDNGVVRMDNSTVAHNGIGIVAIPSVTRSRIVDNVGAGIVTDQFGTVSFSVIAGNGGMGIDNSDIPPEFSFVDARFNYWGAADGPSGPAGSGPIADPVTGRIVDGAGDEVSVWVPGPGEPVPETTVSNVRFDPYLTTPPGETAYDGHYQVDLVVGDPIPQLSAERLYTDERRLVGFLHGQGEEVERTGTAPTLDPETADCVDIQSWAVENGTATVAFTVEEGCDLPSQPREPPQLTLVSYEKPTEGFSRATADQQRLYDFEQIGVRDGTYVLQVDLPEASTNDESSALAAPSAVTWHSIGAVR